MFGRTLCTIIVCILGIVDHETVSTFVVVVVVVVVHFTSVLFCVSTIQKPKYETV